MCSSTRSRARSSLGDDAGRNAALSFADREIAGGNSILVDQLAAYEARALIPADDTFRVVTGPNLKETTPLTLQAISPWLTYFLMPRRQSGTRLGHLLRLRHVAGSAAPIAVLWRDEVGISIGTRRLTFRAITGLVLLNGFLLAVGIGVLYGVRGWRSWGELARLWGFAYLLGVAA